MRPWLALPLALALVASARARPSYGPALNGRIFDRAWGLVEDHYWNRGAISERWRAVRERYRSRVVAATDRRSAYTELGEALAQLGDSHVFAIDPVQVAIGRDEASGRPMGGFGLTMLPDADGAWHVRSLRPGGPAAIAGVEIGWELRAVDGAPVDIDFRPEPGRAVPLIFVDEHSRAHPLTLTAELEREAPARRATMLPGGVLLIGLDGFDPGDARWMRDAIARAGPRAILLDLRANGGGDADAVASVAGLFFAQRRVLVRRIGKHASDQMTGADGVWLGPLAVLIGPESASGAEALAALIDESGRGVTVGERTAGALTGAALYRLPDGGQLSVAEFDIRTPGGRRLEGIGLAPKVPVAPTLAERRAGRDPVLEKARELLTAPSGA